MHEIATVASWIIAHLNPIAILFGWIVIGLLVLAAVSAFTASIAGVTPHPKDALDGTRSIGDLIEAARQGGPAVHIIFVHGINAQGPGTSDAFQTGMLREVKLVEQPRPPRYWLDLGEDPPPAAFAGEPVWDRTTWKRSQPFVDRRIYDAGQARVIVDEVNWWPLVFPLKGWFLVLPEIDLAGPDRVNLGFLAKDQADPPKDTYWPWVTKAQADKAIRDRPRKSGGAPINALLKQQLVNWGFADAVIALGPMRACYQTMMEKVFEHADEGAAPQDNAHKIFVIVSVSLGSFIVMDVLSAPPERAGKAQSALLDRTFDLYFLANQFRLLALGRLWDRCAAEQPEAATAALQAAGEAEAAHSKVSPLHGLALWSQASVEGASSEAQRTLVAATPGGAIGRQIIAFNDPSDALTYEVPDLPDEDRAAGGSRRTKVANVYDRNAVAWLWLFENPLAAHLGHSSNRAVLRTIFRPRRDSSGGGAAKAGAATASRAKGGDRVAC